MIILCTHNSVRSPMLAAMLKKIYGRFIDVESAGVDIREPDPFAAAALDEIGLDISGHEPREVTGMSFAGCEIVIALSEPAYARAREMAQNLPRLKLEYWETSEPPQNHERPREQLMETYRKIRDELETHIYNRYGDRLPS